MEKTGKKILEDGTVKEVTTKYTEVATGLNYLEDGVWRESKDKIEAHPAGAAALSGQYKVLWKRQLNQAGAIEITTTENSKVVTSPRALFYFDRSTGKTVRLAEVKDSIGLIVPPNTVVYRDAFNDIKADIRYTYAKDKFEADVIILERPPSPEAFGLENDTTVLELITETTSDIEPMAETTLRRRERDDQMREQMSQADLTDDEIRFGSLTLLNGTAFAARDGNNSSAKIPVHKRLEEQGQRRFLREQIDYRDAEPTLAKVGAATTPRLSQIKGPRTWPTPLVVREGIDSPMEFGVAGYSGDEFVIDFVAVSGSYASYTFASGETYRLSGAVTVGSGGTVTIEDGAVLKYDSGASLRLENGAQLSCPSTGSAILTAVDDNCYECGAVISQNSALTFYASPAIGFYNPNAYVSMQNLDIRYADVGIHMWTSGTTNFGARANYMRITDANTAMSLSSNQSINATNLVVCANVITTGAGIFTIVNQSSCPTVSAIANQSSTEDSTITVNFTISDDTTAAGSISIEGFEDTGDLYPVLGITAGGSGSSRSLTLTPTANANGTTRIVVHATDADGLVRRKPFNVTLTPVNDLPIVEWIGTRGTIVDRDSSPIVVEVTDPDTDPGNISLTPSWDSQYIQSVALNRTNSAWYAIVTPKPGAYTGETGSTYISLTPNDGSGGSSQNIIFRTFADPDNPDGTAYDLGAPGGMGVPPEACLSCGGSSSGGGRESWPVAMPDIEQFKRTITLPDTFPESPPGTLTGESIGNNFWQAIGGADNVQYTLEADLEANVRVLPEFYRSDSYQYGDTASAGLSPMLRIFNDWASDPAPGSMVTKTLTGRDWVRGGCGAEWGFGYGSAGAHGTDNGLKGAYITVKDVRVVGVKLYDDSCDDGVCVYGSVTANIGSVDAGFPLGRSDYGRRKARLRLHDAVPNIATATPKQLSAMALGDGTEKVYQFGSNLLRQVRIPHGLVDVCSESSNRFCLKFYGADGVGGKGTNGLYATNGLPPLRVLEVCNPNAANLNCVRVAELGSTGQVMRADVFDFFPSAAGTNKWLLSRGNGLRVDRKLCVTNGAVRVETDSVHANTNAPSVQTVEDRMEAFSFGEALVQRTVNPGPDARTAQYTYDTNSTSPGFGKLTFVAYPDGGWQSASYDQLGRLTNVLTGFLDQSPTTNGNLCRRTSYSYQTNGAAGDNGAYRPHLPRTKIVTELGQEVARSYFVYLAGEKREIICPSPGLAWNNASNLVTTTRRVRSGAFRGELESIGRPDGTMVIYQYATNGTTLTTTTMEGKPDAAKTNIVSGRRNVTVVGLAGQPISRHEYDIESGVLLDRVLYSNHDSEFRAGRIDYFDGSFETVSYGCCGMEARTDRNGVSSAYAYDDLKRLISVTTLGAETKYSYDPLGRVILVERRPVGGTFTMVRGTAYDAGGRITHETNAVGAVTKYEEAYVGGQLTRTKTFAFGTSLAASEVETFAKDGTLLRIGGSHTYPRRYEYGVETESGVQRRYRKEIKLDAAGGDTAEWTKVYSDGAGREYKTVFPGAGSPAIEHAYNSSGQLVRSVDPDGVATVYGYNSKGERESTAVDLNANGVLDLATDRVNRQETTVLTNPSGVVVVRTSRYELDIDGSTNSTLVGFTERSTDGLASWTFEGGVTNTLLTVLGNGGTNVVTQTLPGGASIKTVQVLGRVVAKTSFDSNGVPTSSEQYTFDALGRRTGTLDPRTGTTVFEYDGLDRITNTISPAPGSGQASQTYGITYDGLGRTVAVRDAGGGVVTNEFYGNGLLKKTSGTRTYPVQYTYDSQGRMLTMVTWQGFANAFGAATNTWAYDSARGWLLSKSYQGSGGVSYTYTAGGRLKTRLWARSISGGGALTTTYKYGFDDSVSANQHSDLVETSYNDGLTPTLSVSYDRRGRGITLTRGSDGLRQFWDGFSRITGQAYSSGSLAGYRVTNTFDTLRRRASLSVLNGGTTLGSVLYYTYDAAGRLLGISDGTYSGTYGYSSNLLFWQTLTFKETTATRVVATRDFDLVNRLKAISTASALGTESLGSSYVYDSANQRRRRNDQDGSYWVYEYDDRGQVTSGKRYWADGSPVAGQQFEYAHDDIGNRKSTRQGGDATGGSLISVGYGVNLLNQYTIRTNASVVDVVGHGDATGTVTVNGSSTYRRGEYFWKSQQVSNASAPAWTSIVVENVVGGSSSSKTGNLRSPRVAESFVYDADGNLVLDGLWSYTWDGENRLISVQSTNSIATIAWRRVVWEYDAVGRRTRQSVAAWNAQTSQFTNAIDLRMIYDGWQCVAELRGSDNTFLRGYAWGLDLSGSVTGAGGVGGLLWMRPSGGAAQFASNDGNGNVIGLFSGSDGSVSARYEYDPFGGTIRSTGSSSIASDNAFRFSCKRSEDASELVLYEYRAYQTRLGRWLSRDPIEERGGVVLYGFVGNSPGNLVDGNGLDFSAMFNGYNFPTQPLPPTPPIADPGDPNTYGMDWVKGRARNAVIGPDGPWSKAMQKSFVMEIDRERVRKVLRRHCTPYVGDPTSLVIALGGELGEIPPATYVTEVFPFEYRTNPVAAFVGSWSGGSITVLEVDCCKRQATIHVHGLNISGRASATHYPPMGGKYGDHILDDTTDPNAMGHNVSQTFDWQEDLKF